MTELEEPALKRAEREAGNRREIAVRKARLQITGDIVEHGAEGVPAALAGWCLGPITSS